jgi:Xaa-Pro aminopeptidase
VHRIESTRLDRLPGAKFEYASWQEQQRQLGVLLEGVRTAAMQYSPQCMIPYVSLVDAGTVELVRSLGVEVHSSANLVQFFEARWTPAQLELHYEAGRRVDLIRREAFDFIGRRLREQGESSELEIAEFIRRRFTESDLVAEDGPIVGVNANSGDPHYTPTARKHSPIRGGDFVLIDLWAKLREPRAVYYDVTWTGFCGSEPPQRIQQVFDVVVAARDAAVEFVDRARREGRRTCGFEVDDVVRGSIRDRGFGEAFVHRTGHSIGEEVHGNGANIDNFETHDLREIIPRTCFSVEPGVYLDDFGVRSEIDCYVSEDGARPTGEVQTEIVRIG